MPSIIFVALLTLAVLTGCDRPTTSPPAAQKNRQVVVYCSADAPVARPIFEAFEKKTGIKVQAVFDTEATKTTGLVNRLLSEHEQGSKGGGGGCDVWWSSEPFGSIRLAKAGVLEKITMPRAEQAWADSGGWPRELRAADGTWYGFARRLRVIIYNTKHVKADELPRHLRDLSNPAWKGRVGMARPQFGTTRGHMAAIHSLDDGRSLRTWLTAMVGNDLRLYDGNASVARAVGSGEMWLALTDSDDAIIGRGNGWPVDYVTVSDVCMEPWSIRDAAAGVGGAGGRAPYPETPLQPPSSVGLVKGVANLAEANELIEFLLSDEAAELLSMSEFHALPTRPATSSERLSAAWTPSSRQRLPGLPHAVPISEMSFERVAEHVEPAMKVCEELLKGR